jgi:hypothetical protein
MEVFEVVIAMLLGGAALAALARRFGAPYPALVAAFQRVEEELDWTELGWAQVVGSGQANHSV